MRVLVVEDDDFTRLELVKLLQKERYEVDSFDNVADGLRALKVHRYDFVLSDLNLPRDSGLDFLEKTKGDPPFILYSSGPEYSEISEIAERNGALVFITKFTLPNLLERAISAFTKSVKDNTEQTNQLLTR